MITNGNQRWRDRRGSYRPTGETIRTGDYEVAVIADDKTAKDFVVQHHYSATFPAARFRFGLYRGGELVGVAVFSHPSNDRVLAIFPGKPIESVELGRLVLLDDVPANGESFFVARCFDHLRREQLTGVVSFSDPVARTDAAGVATFKGHVGTIYQALNAVYLGRATARTLRLLPDGTTFNDRAAQKIRKRERGWEYASQQLVRHGARPLAASADATEWLREQLPRVTRPLKHAGNFRYAWMLDKRQRRHLPESQPYPKMIIEATPDGVAPVHAGGLHALGARGAPTLG